VTKADASDEIVTAQVEDLETLQRHVSDTLDRLCRQPSAKLSLPA
jgi:hypothetical protein